MRPFSILFVEDDVGQASSLAKLMHRIVPDLSITIVESLSEGLNASRELNPNVSFLDLMIPWEKGGTTMDWREVALHIKTFVPPVVVITCIDDPDSMIEFELSARYGAARVFQKPKVNNLIKWLAGTNQEQFAAHLLSAAGAADIRARGAIYEDAATT